MARALPARSTRECIKGECGEGRGALATEPRALRRSLLWDQAGGARAPVRAVSAAWALPGATVRRRLADIAGAVPGDGGVAASSAFHPLPRCEVGRAAAGRAFW